MKLGIVTLNVSIVAGYIVSSSKSTLPIGVVVGGLIGGLALILAMVAFYLFKPIISTAMTREKMIVYPFALPCDDCPNQF
jgi:hypothetical protein